MRAILLSLSFVLAVCSIGVEAQQRSCNRVCPETFQPVCGTDNVTYGNLCQLSIATCRSGVVLKHPGKCGSVTGLLSIGRQAKPINRRFCTPNSCRFGAQCRPQPNGLSKCQCRTVCSDIVDPVCGSDRNTYSNECRLMVQMCKSQQPIEVAREGSCSSSPTSEIVAE